MEITHTRRRRRRRNQPVWPYVLIGLLVVVLIAVVIFAVAMSGGKLVLELVGERDMILEFGQGFTDPGVKVLRAGKEIDAEVSISGQVSADLLGEYTLTYEARAGLSRASVTRTVRVVDTQAPTIVLMYNTGSYTLPGEEYKEEGYVAEDNYDGDITEKVTRTVEGDVVIYSVTDSSGNTAEVKRTIQYGDYTAPDLTLEGEETVTIQAGTAYDEPGYSAVDNVDGDVTDQVVVSGDYDIYSPGTYTITYSVTDSWGNTAQVQRTLVVEGISQPGVVVPSGKVIYLTFDDGPGEHTPSLLQILAKYNVKATFFVVGTANSAYLDDIVDQGHSIAAHSYSHVYSEIYASEEAYFKDLNKVRQLIYDKTGTWTTLIRFPGGSSNSVSRKHCLGIMSQLTKAVEAQGLQYFDWNVDSMDAGGAKTADEVFSNVIAGVQKHNVSVVLQHDIHGYSVDAVERIIQWGLANGYTFLPLTSTSPNAHHGVRN